MTAARDRTTLVLLDVPSLLEDAYRAVPPSAAVALTGQSTNAIFGVLSRALEAVSVHQPTHLAAIFPGATPGARERLLGRYRAPGSAPAVVAQSELLRNLLPCLGIAALAAPTGYEAADLIAASAAGFDGDVVILSADSRLWQTISATTTLVHPMPGRPLIPITATTLHDEHGVSPATALDYLTLRGDRPRGIPPIPGVGDKTALAWLRQHESLAKCLANEPKLHGRADQLRIHQQLLQLDTTIPAPGAEEMRQARRVDHAAIRQALAPLGLTSLTDRTTQALGITVGDTAPASRIAAGDVSKWLVTHADSKKGEHALVVSGTTAVIATPACTVGLLNLTSATTDDREALGAWLCDPHVPKIVHDAKALLHALRPHGWSLNGIHLDVALAGYLLDPGANDYSLPALATRHLREHTEPSLRMSLSERDSDEEEIAVRHARLIAELAPLLTDQLTITGMYRLYSVIEAPTTPLLAELEARGIAVDRAHLDALHSEYTAAAAAATATAATELGHPINLGSTAQLQAALFTELKMPPTRRIKSGYSTAAADLIRLQQQHPHPFLTALLEYRAAIKLAQMIAGLIKHISDDDRIHTTLRQMTVETGRLSSEAPNLQNIPIRTINGARIREGFVPGPGFDVLLSADYSQLEMRIMAHASGDQALIEAFRSGEDMHRYVAALAFNTQLADVTPEQRRRAKAISYGLAYGQTVHGLATHLDIPLNEAREHHAAYFARFGAVREYLDGLVERAHRTGYTETMYGRRRLLPALTEDNRRTVNAAERAALNAPIQGAAADIIKMAMVQVEEQIAWRRLRARMLLQVHDELVFEVPRDEVEELTGLLRTIMPRVADLSVPLEVSIGTGPSWAHAH